MTAKSAKKAKASGRGPGRPRKTKGRKRKGKGNPPAGVERAPWPADLNAMMAKDVAVLFGVSAQAVGMWVKNEGCPRTAADGRGTPGQRYRLQEVIEWHVRARMKPGPAARLTAAPVSGEAGESDAAWSGEAELKYTRAQLERQRHLAEITKMEAQRRRGKLIELAEAVRREALLATVFKQALLRLPREVAQRAAGRSAAEVEELLTDRVRRILEELSGQAR